MRVTLKPRWANEEPLVVLIDDGTVTLEDGTVVGRVRKGSRTWERRPYRGARYVTARGTVPEWHGWYRGSMNARPDVADDTRVGCIRKLLGDS